MILPGPLHTQRLIIRPYERRDRDFCLSLWCDKENGRYLSDPVLEAADARYLSLIDEMADEKDGFYLIAELKGSDIPVATCCAFPEGDNCDIGYCVCKEMWRQGYGGEMIKALIGWAEHSGMASLSAEVADDNAASVALLKKFGFRADRITRYKKRGEETYFDAHVYVLALGKNIGG